MDVVQIMDLIFGRAAPISIFFAGLIALGGCATAPRVEGHIDPDALAQTMKSHERELSACYEKSEPHKTGFVEARFRVNDSGTVIQSTIQMSTLEDPPVESCLLEQIRSISFPSPVDGNEAQALYSFKFPSGTR
jgi:hypothetical protein